MRQPRCPSLCGALAGAVVLAHGAGCDRSDVPWQAIAYGRRIAPILHGLTG